MNAPDFFAGDLLEGAGDDRLCQNIIEHVSVVDILGSLTDTEHRGLFRQMTGREQSVAALICWDRVPIQLVFVAVHIVGILVVGVHRSAPANHVDRIVIEQFVLGCKFRDVVTGAGAGGEQLHPAAAETGQGSLGSHGIRIGYLIAFVQGQHDVLMMPLYPPLDMALDKAQFVQRHQHKIPGPDAVQIGHPFHEHIGQAVVGQHHFPVVADGDS